MASSDRATVTFLPLKHILVSFVAGLTVERRVVVPFKQSLRKLCRLRRTLHRRVGDATACHPDQPSGGIASARIEAVPITKSALERLARLVLSVGTGADPVGGVRIEAADQWARIASGSRIAETVCRDDVDSGWVRFVNFGEPLQKGAVSVAADRPSILLEAYCSIVRPRPGVLGVRSDIHERIEQAVLVACSEEPNFPVVEVLPHRRKVRDDRRDAQRTVFEELRREGESVRPMGRLGISPAEAPRMRSSTTARTR